MFSRASMILLQFFVCLFVFSCVCVCLFIYLVCHVLFVCLFVRVFVPLFLLSFVCLFVFLFVRESQEKDGTRKKTMQLGHSKRRHSVLIIATPS